MLGIIGSNGAGKSTLLKAISGIMVPTDGLLYTDGSVVALLELTAGFDGDLTVKENTYLCGAMLGYTREFMDEKYDEIIGFAELESFQDRSFKQLSSGMKSRLAFRKKSGDEMREVLSGGVTGILVSHSVPQIRELCNKILWLDHGNKIYFSDEVELYCDAYEEFIVSKKVPKNKKDVEELSNAYHNRIALEKKEKDKKEAAKLEKAMEKGNENAVEAVLYIIKKNRPELLK